MTPSTQEKIKGRPLKEKPEKICRCGMSQAAFAQHLFTSQWYEISTSGKVIGSALDLDFYKHDGGQGPSSRTTGKTKELSKV